MAFGLKRTELNEWKRRVVNGEIAFLTHYWQDERFPGCVTVTKVGCNDLNILIEWGRRYQLKEEWIDHHRLYPHFDLFGKIQKDILLREGLTDHVNKFKL